MAEVELSDIELSRLFDCATSSKYGIADKGFPITFKKLEPLGLVKPINGGYVITEYGLAYLKANRDKFLLGSKKKKKPKYRKRDDDYSDSEDET